MPAPSQSDIQAGVPTGANIVQRISAPGGGEWLIGEDGGVFAIGGAPYLGSYTGLDAGTRNDPNRRFKGAEAAGGGYALISNTGERYQFDAPQPASPQTVQPTLPDSLMSDPAFLAFMRTSGTELEVAANQVNRQTLAAKQAETTALGDESYNTQRNEKLTSGGFQSRGITRSGAHQKALQEEARASAQRKTTIQSNTANTIAGLSEGLTNRVIGVQKEAAERGLTTGQTQALDQGIEAIRRKPEFKDAFSSGLVR